MQLVTTRKITEIVVTCLCAVSPNPKSSKSPASIDPPYMSSSRNQALPSSRKTHSERHKQILRQLSKESANKNCADCKTAAHPRWASWNLGCFVCIRCSGIHRSMGTHISKVKSVDLDAWTDEQVELMVKWGNAKCNSYWESKLPDGYVPDQLKIENFIRTKYDLKKWVSSPQVPDPLKMSSSTQQAPTSAQVDVTNNQQKSASESAIATNTTKTASLLDDFGSFVTTNKPAVTTQASPMPRASLAALAPVTLPSRSSTASPAASSAKPAVNGRPDLKKSILSLYSSPSTSTPTLTAKQPYSLSNSLSGLNLGSPTPSPQPRVDTSSPVTANAFASSKPQTAAELSGWANEWSDTTWKQTLARSGAEALNNALDEDLFRNVWK